MLHSKKSVKLDKMLVYSKLMHLNQLTMKKKSKMKKIVITNTIDNTKKIKGNSKIEVVSIAPLIAEAIKRISQSTSVSSLFK